jgi:hypothetical protein
VRAVRFVNPPQAIDVLEHGPPQADRKRAAPVACALALSHQQLPAIDVDVLHAETQSLEQSQPTTVEQRGNETVARREGREHGTDFAAAQDDRHRPKRSSAHGVDPLERAVEHVPIQEQQCG